MHQGTRTRRNTKLVAVLVALGVGLGAAGCTPGKDANASPAPVAASAAPSPTPSPSVDPVEAAKQEQMDAAKAAYLEYIRLDNEALQAGGGEEQWQKVLPYLATDDAVSIHDFYLRMAAEGSHREGEVTVEVTATGYAGDPLDPSTVQEVTLDACVDSTKASVVKPGGTPGVVMVSARIYSRNVMRTQPDGRWALAQSDGGDRAC